MPTCLCLSAASGKAGSLCLLCVHVLCSPLWEGSLHAHSQIRQTSPGRKLSGSLLSLQALRRQEETIWALPTCLSLLSGRRKPTLLEGKRGNSPPLSLLISLLPLWEGRQKGRLAEESGMKSRRVGERAPANARGGKPAAYQPKSLYLSAGRHSLSTLGRRAYTAASLLSLTSSLLCACLSTYSLFSFTTCLSLLTPTLWRRRRRLMQ